MQRVDYRFRCVSNVCGKGLGSVPPSPVLTKHLMKTVTGAAEPAQQANLPRLALCRGLLVRGPQPLLGSLRRARAGGDIPVRHVPCSRITLGAVSIDDVFHGEIEEMSVWRKAADARVATDSQFTATREHASMHRL